MSRALVKLDTCVPIDDSLAIGPIGRGRSGQGPALFDEFGFRRLAEQFLAIRGRMPVAAADAEEPSCKPVFTTIDTPEALAALIAEMRQQKQISIDTETTHIWPRWAEIVGISLSWNENQAYYLPFRGPEGSRLLDPQATLDALRPMLEDPAIGKLGQNLKYDRIVLRAAGVELCGEAFDTMVASYLLDAGQRNHNLDYLAKRYLHHTTIKIEELIGSGKHQKRMDEVPIPQITDYAAEDAWVPVRLQPLLARRMEVDELAPLFRDVEMPLIDVLVELEYNGIKIDVARLGRIEPQLRRANGAIGAGDLCLGGPAVQHRLAAAASGRALRRAEAAGAQADGQDGAEHRRRRAGGARPEASAAGQDRRVSPVCQAQGDVRRQPARDGQSEDRPRTRVVQSGRRRHGAAQLARSRTCRTSPCGPRPGAVFARPSCPARRAGRSWRPTIRRSSCGCWPITRATSGCARPFSATRTSTPWSRRR